MCVYQIIVMHIILYRQRNGGGGEVAEGGRCHKKYDLPIFWYPHTKYSTIFGIPEPYILRKYGIPLGNFAPPIYIE